MPPVKRGSTSGLAGALAAIGLDLTQPRTQYIVALVLLVIALWHTYQMWKNRRLDGVSIRALTVYPIKSCSGINVSAVSTDWLGFLWDRRFFVVDKRTHKLLSQKQVPRLWLVKPSFVFSANAVAAVAAKPAAAGAAASAAASTLR